MTNTDIIDILVNGRPVKKYSHNGKLFIEAKAGTEYSIRIRNNAWTRKLAVASVDGINVLTGEPAGSQIAGYVINSTAVYDIKGFRTSNDVVNAFVFSKKSKSYAAKSDQTGGDTTNCGVIGVKLYFEYVPPVIPRQDVLRFGGGQTLNSPIRKEAKTSYRRGAGGQGCSLPPALKSFDTVSDWHELDRSVSFSASTSSLTPEPNFDLGTQFSNKEITDKVKTVDFQVGGLDIEIQVFYASREALKSMGVVIEKEPLVAFPSAFPSKFCKPPRR